MALLQQNKVSFLISFFTVCLIVLSAHADPILRAGMNTSYIVKKDDQSYTWGFGRNTRDQMFLNYQTQQSQYTRGRKVMSACGNCHSDKGNGIRDIAPSKYMSHTLVYGPQSGLVRGHGDNTYGQLGNDLTTDNTNVHDIGNFELSDNAIGCAAASGYSSFVIQSDGTVLAAGRNNYGQLGDGTTTTRKEMVHVKIDATTNLTNVKAVSSGLYHTLFVTNDGNLYVCGRNNHKQLGYNIPDQPYATLAGTGINKVAAGAYHSVILSNDGYVSTAGYGYYGQLANGSTADAYWTCWLDNVIDIDAGGYFSMCLTSSKVLHTAGRNDKGQLGDGTTSNKVWWTVARTNVDLIAAGYDHSLIWQRDGNTFFTCGNNIYGQCGTGTSGNYYTTWQTVQFE